MFGDISSFLLLKEIEKKTAPCCWQIVSPSQFVGVGDPWVTKKVELFGGWKMSSASEVFKCWQSEENTEWQMRHAGMWRYVVTAED